VRPLQEAGRPPSTHPSKRLKMCAGGTAVSLILIRSQAIVPAFFISSKASKYNTKDLINTTTERTYRGKRNERES